MKMQPFSALAALLVLLGVCLVWDTTDYVQFNNRMVERNRTYGPAF